MSRLILEQVKKLEFDAEYLVMFRSDQGHPFFKIATYYYESPSDMHLWSFDDEMDEIEVGDEISVFESPENGIIDGVDAEFIGKDEIIEDGFGSAWSAWCPECKKKAMFVVRPGKVQCGNCE
jgi:hypothetical protein